MRRREFLVASAALATAGGGALWLSRAHRHPRDGLRLGEGAYAVIKALRGTDPIAKVASEGTPRSAKSLEDILIQHLDLQNSFDISASDFAKKIVDAVREDFRQKRFCKTSPWLISETECYAAALRLSVFGPLSSDAPSEDFSEGKIVDVEDWGERETELDTPFNVQTDGHSGIWIKAHNAPPWLKFQIDDERVQTFHSSGVITTGLYGGLQGRVLSKIGEHPVALVDEMARIRQPLGVFTVKPRTPRLKRADGSISEVFCPIGHWGPRGTVVGQAANPQPGSAEGLWIKTTCAPNTVRVLFGSSELRTTVSRGIITAVVPLTKLNKPGEIPIRLRDTETGEVADVGMYVISEREASKTGAAN